MGDSVVSAKESHLLRPNAKATSGDAIEADWETRREKMVSRIDNAFCNDMLDSRRCEADPGSER